MCPMLWCRQSFKDADTTVSHVFGCPLLPNGWYWCPSCKRAERFLECDKACDIVRKARLQKRGTNLAVMFFKWLGRRCSRKKAELGKACQTVASETEKPELCARRVSWYLTELPAPSIFARDDMSRYELPSPRRAEMFGSIPADAAEVGSDDLKRRKLGLKIPVTPPLSKMSDTCFSNNLELSTPDPVYWTTELRDRASFNTPDARTAISPATSYDLQADSYHGKNPLGANIQGRISAKASRMLDEQCSNSPFDDCFEENADSSTLSLGHDYSVPQVASPSTPSPNIPPMPNFDPPISLNRQVLGVSAIGDTEDGNNSWRLKSSILSTPKVEEMHS